MKRHCRKCGKVGHDIRTCEKWVTKTLKGAKVDPVVIAATGKKLVITVELV